MRRRVVLGGVSLLVVLGIVLMVAGLRDRPGSDDVVTPEPNSADINTGGVVDTARDPTPEATASNPVEALPPPLSVLPLSPASSFNLGVVTSAGEVWTYDPLGVSKLARVYDPAAANLEPAAALANR